LEVQALSFSSNVKNELCRIELEKDCCLLAELAAVVRVSGTVRLLGEGEANIKIVTENAAFARRIFTYIKKYFNIYPEVIARKSNRLKRHTSYILIITSSMGAEHILKKIGMLTVDEKGAEKINSSLDWKRAFKSQCCRRSFLRGAFLAGGSVTDPEKTYHLEITSHSKALAVETSKLINSFGLNAKVIKRKESYVIYLKEGENIVDFLNIIGAHSALMDLENVRIIKEMRNNVNRIVNCETANLEKTVNASFRQVENIKFIRDHGGLEKLPPGLREIAELRLDYTDASLKELGEMLNPPLGKSGVNHRLRKLDEIADNLRERLTES
jgi:DNA-binding protein WhiA